MIPLTIKIMLFKRPRQRTILFTSVLLSTTMQEALDTYSSDRGCMFVPLPPTLDSLGEMSRVVWPDLEIVVDPGILDPNNKMELAETFGAYSCYFVVNPTVKNHAIFS